MWCFLSSATNPISLTKYGFPNSPHSCCFQLSPRPGGTLRAASLSSAAALFLWMRTSCSALSGESGGVACSLCSTRAFLAGLACQESGSGVRLRSLAPRGARRLRANLKDRRPKTPMVQPRRGPAMPAYVSTALHAGFSRQNSSRFLPLLIGPYEGRGGADTLHTYWLCGVHAPFPLVDISAWRPSTRKAVLNP